MTDMGATWRVPVMLRVLGFAMVGLSLTAVTSAALFYVQLRPFSIFSTYLSDMGNTPVWPQVFFNAGMLLGAPLRFLFLILIVAVLAHLGAGRGFSIAALTAGAVLFAASVGTFAVPFGLHRSIHLGSALVAFFGTVGLFLLIAAQEWRRGLPRVLPVSSLAVAAASLVFATLLTLVGRAPGVTRDTPVIWEWLTFALMIAWTISHSVLLGRPAART